MEERRKKKKAEDMKEKEKSNEGIYCRRGDMNRLGKKEDKAAIE